MSHLSYPDELIGRVLAQTKTIAMVGASGRPDRPSNSVMRYMQIQGYRVIPVNPTETGGTINGERVLASLTDIQEPVDMVDCFRRSEAIPALIDDVIKIGAKVLWMQLGVRHDEAAARAEAAGIDVVMDRCPVIEIRRLGLGRR